MEKTKLIWVSEELAMRYENLESDEEKYKTFQEYIEKVSEESKKEFRANLDALEEDVAIYTGLMLKVKQAFEKAKTEQINASYQLWENFEKELPSIHEKIDSITDTLNPLEIKLKTINEQLAKIQTWNVEQVIKVIEDFNCLYGKNKLMFEFLMNNFKE